MTVRIYCGTRRGVPVGYGRNGTRYECLQCGYGSAMAKYSGKPRRNGPKGCFRTSAWTPNNKRPINFQWILLGVIVFIVTILTSRFAMRISWLLSVFCGCIAIFGFFYIFTLIYR